MNPYECDKRHRRKQPIAGAKAHRLGQGRLVGQRRGRSGRDASRHPARTRRQLDHGEIGHVGDGAAGVVPGDRERVRRAGPATRALEHRQCSKLRGGAAPGGARRVRVEEHGGVAGQAEGEKAGEERRPIGSRERDQPAAFGHGRRHPRGERGRERRQVRERALRGGRHDHGGAGPVPDSAHECVDDRVVADQRRTRNGNQERYTNLRFGGGPVTPQPWDFDVAVIGAGQAAPLPRPLWPVAVIACLCSSARRFPASTSASRSCPGSTRCSIDSASPPAIAAGGFVPKWGASFTTADGSVERYADFCARGRSAAAADLSGAPRAVRSRCCSSTRCVGRHGATGLPRRRRGLRRRRRHAHVRRGGSDQRPCGSGPSSMRRAAPGSWPPVRQPRARPAAAEHRRASPVRGCAARRGTARGRHPHGDPARPRLVLVHPDQRHRDERGRGHSQGRLQRRGTRHARGDARRVPRARRRRQRRCSPRPSPSARRASTPTIRICTASTPAIASCSWAMPAPFSIRSSRPACCWRCSPASRPPRR